MRLALTSGLVRRSEQDAVAAGATLSDLMERAGKAVAAYASELAPQGGIAIAAGRGNNGGDGWVAARLLRAAGREVRVIALASPADLPFPAAAAAEAAVSAGVEWSVADDATAGGTEVAAAFGEAALVIDALLGIGASGAPRGACAGLVGAIGKASALVLAVDVPSGVDADTGAVPGTAVRAAVTVTFDSLKVGLVLRPGADLAGEIVIADIGLPSPSDAKGALEVWDLDDHAALLPLPGPEDHKGTRGRVLVIGGSPGLTGAVCLAASGALRAGAGYVTVAAPEPSLAVVEVKLTAPVKVAVPVDADGGVGPEGLVRLTELAGRADAVVLGPGLGRAASTAETVRGLLERLRCPVVVDADALWALGSDVAILRSRDAAVVITPHSGEAARLLGVSREALDADRPAAARALAGGGVTCVLKGQRTLISDGERVVVTRTGGPGLATLGTGDVLSGIVGALLAQGLAPLDAAALGAHLHGAAGDAATEELTSVCCTAEDVLTYLHKAVGELLVNRRPV